MTTCFGPAPSPDPLKIAAVGLVGADDEGSDDPWEAEADGLVEAAAFIISNALRGLAGALILVVLLDWSIGE